MTYLAIDVHLSSTGASPVVAPHTSSSAGFTGHRAEVATRAEALGFAGAKPLTFAPLGHPVFNLLCQLPENFQSLLKGFAAEEVTSQFIKTICNFDQDCLALSYSFFRLEWL